MKKLIALFLALALAASLGAAAWAAEDAPADRAAAAAVLWDLAGRPVVNYAPGFEDLDAGADYMDAVRWAASEGIIKGYDARTFGPNDPVTREQFAVMIYRYAQSLGLGFRGAWYFPLDYADAGEISDWANEAVHWVVMNGKPEFADGRLQPKASLTHGNLDAIAAAFARGLAGESAGADIAEKLVGRWTIAERNGQSVLTNAKGVFTFPSPDKAYISASFNSRPELGGAWIHQTEADVAIEGGKVTLTWSADGKTTMADELTVLSITDDEVVGSLTVKQTENGAETIIAEDAIRFVKVGADYSDAILGTWEGHMTSAQSKFGDEEDHRWEYRADGTYVYYEKDGGSWVPGDDTFNEYFVAGNLLCTRWGENGDENREWWEITIDGDAMHWTALRAGDDGTTYTAAFEMTKVAQ